MDQLSRSNRNASSPLPVSGHLDLSRIGAFGHSFGGIAAAHACQIDRRLKACLNQDGLVSKKPFYLDPRGWGMDQAFMLIQRAPDKTPPTDKDLAEMKITRQRAEQILLRLEAQQETALRSIGKGSYQVLLQNKLTTHMDFSDLEILGAMNRSEAETHGRILSVVRSYTLAFFDKTLRDKKVPLLDLTVPGEYVEAVRRFAPAKAK